MREPLGTYFEDWEVGRRDLTRRRAVSQTDIISFSHRSGDCNGLRRVPAARPG